MSDRIRRRDRAFLALDTPEPALTCFAVILALLAGAMLPVQAAVNARLGRTLGLPIWGAAVSGAVLTLIDAQLAEAAAGASPYLRMSGLTIAAWLLARQAVAAAGRLADNDEANETFLRSEITIARCFVEHVNRVKI